MAIDSDNQQNTAWAMMCKALTELPIPYLLAGLDGGGLRITEEVPDSNTLKEMTWLLLEWSAAEMKEDAPEVERAFWVGVKKRFAQELEEA